MARKFIYDGQTLADPDPAMSIDEVRQSLAEFLPELYNATNTEKKDKDDTVITFEKRVGKKGSGFKRGIGSRLFRTPFYKPWIFIRRIWECTNLFSMCSLGCCLKNHSTYDGGGPADMWEKFSKGICPICGGAAEVVKR